MTDVHIDIIVYRGSPLDYPHYRHTGLWLRFADGSPPLLVHIVGPRGEFVFETRQDHTPWDTQRDAKSVKVGDLTVAASHANCFCTSKRLRRQG